MKKWMRILTAVIMAAFLGACGGTGETPAPIGEAEEQVPEEEPMSIQEQLELGQRYLVELNYDEAIVVFTKIIDIDPRNIEAWTGLATAYVNTQDYRGAAKAYAAITQERPEDVDAHYMRGITQVLSGDNDEGEQSLLRGLELAEEEDGTVSEEALQHLLDEFDALGISIVSEEDADYYHAYVLEMPDGSHVLLIRYADGSVSAQVLDAGEEVPAQAIPDALLYFVWKNNMEYATIDTMVFHEDGTVTLTYGSEEETLPYYISGGDDFYPAGSIYIGSPDFMSPDAIWAAYFTEYEGRKGLGVSGIHFGDSNFLEPVRP